MKFSLSVSPIICQLPIYFIVTIGYCLGTSFYVSCLIQVRVVSNSRRHVGLSHFHLIADLFQTAAYPRWGYMMDDLLEHVVHSFKVLKMY